MQNSTTFARVLIRVTGTAQIILGVLFWTGHAEALVPVHVLIGSVLVLSLWTLALAAARAGVDRRLVIVAFVWGLIVPLLGLAQTNVLTGGAHWVVQVVHLLVGLGAIGQGESLAVRIESGRSARIVPPAQGYT